MVAKNDVTGDSIISKSQNKNYVDNYDKIFQENFGSIVHEGKEYKKCSRRCWLEINQRGKLECKKPTCTGDYND